VANRATLGRPGLKPPRDRRHMSWPGAGLAGDIWPPDLCVWPGLTWQAWPGGPRCLQRALGPGDSIGAMGRMDGGMADAVPGSLDPGLPGLAWQRVSRWVALCSLCVSATAVAVQTEARAGQGRPLQKPRSTSCPLLFCLPAGLRSGGPRDGSRLWSGKRRHRVHGMTGSLGWPGP